MTQQPGQVPVGEAFTAHEREVDVLHDHQVSPLPDVTQADHTGGTATDGKVGEVKDAAASVASTAAEQGQRVAEQAKVQAGEVAGEARKQLRDLTGQARAQLVDQAGAQQTRVAGGLRDLSDELVAMAGLSNGGYATDLVEQLADRFGSAAHWLDSRDPGHLLEDVRHFARQRPGTFLALAAGAGLLAGRLTRGLKDASDTVPSHHPVVGEGAVRPDPLVADPYLANPYPAAEMNPDREPVHRMPETYITPTGMAPITGSGRP